MPVGARYGSQYLFGCPDCHNVALPGVVPAATAIDWDIEAPIIGERKKDLASSTRDRIKRGLERLMNEPFAIRISGKGYGANPKPLTLPLISLTARHDVAMVMPVAGNTFESTPGNRARAAHLQPGDTVHTTLDRAMVIPLVKNTAAQNPDVAPTHPMMARGFHHGLLRPVVMRNYTPKGSKGEMTTPVEEPFRTLTSKCNQSLVVPYQSEPHKPLEPMKTVMTRDRMALLIPPNTNNPARDPFTDPATTLTTETRCSLVSLPEVAA